MEMAYPPVFTISIHRIFDISHGSKRKILRVLGELMRGIQFYKPDNSEFTRKKDGKKVLVTLNLGDAIDLDITSL